ncbi:MAG TPA: long-chain fatty acid--CoA ligase, partial [Terriglobia bacterium]|nr:long-chain fatty acid--CoA ligase [Terriglobia bacterium]
VCCKSGVWESMESKPFQTINELFLKAMEDHQKPDAFLTKAEGRYRGVSSRDVLLNVAALAQAFREMGVAAGDRVALLSENRLEWALTDYAILGLGGVTVPFYSTLLEEDVHYILRDSGSKGIIVSTRDQLKKVLAVRSGLPDLKFVVAMDAEPAEFPDVLCWTELAERRSAAGTDQVKSLEAQALRAQPSDVATIVYTSGTTGVFKGVVLTHANIASNIQACDRLFDFHPGDVSMAFLPLAHIFERMIDFYYMAQGVSIAYAESIDTLPQNLREVRPTLMAVVPRLVEKIREKVMDEVGHLPASKQRLFGWALRTGREWFPYHISGRSAPLGLGLKRALADKVVYARIRSQMGGRLRLLISGAAPLSRKLAEFFFSIGIPIYEGYGLTETSPVITVNYPGAVKLGTVGQVIPGVEVRLGEETEDAEGHTGREILVRGPNVTPGYYRPDEKNGEAFVDGWFRTGDLGLLDKEGFLSITGRKKNLFKTSGGKYVSPERLENLFQGHRYVAQLVVLGNARKFVGSLIVPNFAALESYAREQGIEFASRQDLVKNEIIHAFLQAQVDETCRHLPPHERIRQIALLPKELTIGAGELSATLKVKRPVVEERYCELIEEMFSRRPPATQETSVNRK